jgi:hypothetical protein
MSEPAGYPFSAVERAMKVQDVIVRAIDGRVTWDPSRRDLGDLGSPDAPLETAV